MAVCIGAQDTAVADPAQACATVGAEALLLYERGQHDPVDASVHWSPELEGMKSNKVAVPLHTGTWRWSRLHRSSRHNALAAVVTNFRPPRGPRGTPRSFPRWLASG